MALSRIARLPLWLPSSHFGFGVNRPPLVVAELVGSRYRSLRVITHCETKDAGADAFPRVLGQVS